MVCPRVAAPLQSPVLPHPDAAPSPAPQSAADDAATAAWAYGANQDLAARIRCHLFVVAPNNSGSTFLYGALAACAGAWALPVEGQAISGYAGPVTLRGARLAIWADSPRKMALFADPARHDWPRNRKTWYFHARAKCADASVFVEKSSQHVLQVAQLASHFPDARFLFMVRNPYAVCEGICRNYRRRFGGPSGADLRLEARAAKHVVNCLAHQRANVEAERTAPARRGIAFTYEQMCANPAAVARQIERLVPALGEVDLRPALPVKGRYREPLRNMNGEQIAALAPRQIATFNATFEAHRSLLGYFGYDMLPAASQPAAASAN